jgi:response regulator NasT
MLRILLIDDTRNKLGRLKAALREAGFEVIEAPNLTIDLPSCIETVRPDVVLIDTDSPDRDVMEQVVLVSRDQQLAERKRIEQAKGLLMKMKDCNEEQAYTLMRRQAMSRQQKLIQVAEQIIAMHEMLG